MLFKSLNFYLHHHIYTKNENYSNTNIKIKKNLNDLIHFQCTLSVEFIVWFLLSEYSIVGKEFRRPAETESLPYFKQL